MTTERSGPAPPGQPWPPPSGEQHLVRAGGYEAVVVQVGGGLRRLRHDGSDLVAGYPIDAICDGGRGQILAPWPNRVADGRYVVEGRTLQLDLSDPAGQAAIHGLVRWEPWRLAERHDDHVRLTHRLSARPGYPWTLDLEVDYRLGTDGLTVTMRARNLTAVTVPYAQGAHPYLSVGHEEVDQARLLVPARTALRTDSRGLPTGRVRLAGAGGHADPDSSSVDFSTDRSISTAVLDTPYTDLVRDADGRARARLQVSGRPEVVLWVDEGFGWIQVFTGDTLAPQHRRRGLALEPNSAPPNALATGEDLTWLAPGADVTGRWGIYAVG
ncbi:MAG: aldose 1-epimerase family protein [Actinomycetes bacterium]